MKETGNIINENPQYHWGFMKVKDLVVLDLGCGCTWEQVPSTPEYFLNSGASKVIGVEMWPKEVDNLTELINDDRLQIITDEVNSIEKMRFYLKGIDVLKCDIEGDEKYLADMTIEDFANIKEVAAEYHNPEMKQMFIDKYQVWGFKNIDLYSISLFDSNKQGVIHLTK